MSEYTDEMAAAWKREHGALKAIKARTGTLVLRAPKRGEWDRYVDKMGSEPGQRSSHSRELAQSCLVHPSPSEMREILDAHPALLMNEVVDALGALAGFATEEAVVSDL